MADHTSPFGIRLQPADGPVDDRVLVGDLNGRTVCICHRLHPVKDDLECAVARRPRDGVYQSLGLNDVMQ